MNTVEILLIEDSLDDAELAISALRKKNLAGNLFHVEDGEEALEFLLGEGRYHGRGTAQPKLILLDLKMPKLSGLEVLEIIRKDPRTASFPVVILTSSNEEPDIERAYELGANSYIVKLVTFEKFTDVVATVVFYWVVVNQTMHH